ncbi:MAG: protein-L-isoaspartate(D-aspartate) O-methyltransferase [Opitutaceae bacterium]|nr:protein-L-isoaspartate(D-aspartate) O-methyltransferase [Opitutaceae bacterium]
MSWGEQHALVGRAVRAVPRERFVPAEQRSHANEDMALPIGFAQTISQPSLVRFMTEQLALARDMRVLEIGTGSGYQTAILAEIAADVFTVERVPQLGERARSLLLELGYRNIAFRIGDGALGWPEESPFGAIVLTAAATQVPHLVLQQLAPGGRMVAPVGSTPNDQTLYRFAKDLSGRVEQTELCGVRFVPLITPTLP